MSLIGPVAAVNPPVPQFGCGLRWRQIDARRRAGMRALPVRDPRQGWLPRDSHAGATLRSTVLAGAVVDAVRAVRRRSAARGEGVPGCGSGRQLGSGKIRTAEVASESFAGLRDQRLTGSTIHEAGPPASGSSPPAPYAAERQLKASTGVASTSANVLRAPEARPTSATGRALRRILVHLNRRRAGPPRQVGAC
jgi:hypothetical protein